MKNKEISALIETKQANSCEKISEIDFVKIIDSIYAFVHFRTLKNAPIKMYPDLKISEYKDLFNL